MGLKTKPEDLAWPAHQEESCASRSLDRRTRGVAAKLASEGSKVAVDAVLAGRIFATMTNSPLRGMYRLGVV